MLLASVAVVPLLAAIDQSKLFVSLRLGLLLLHCIQSWQRLLGLTFLLVGRIVSIKVAVHLDSSSFRFYESFSQDILSVVFEQRYFD